MLEQVDERRSSRTGATVIELLDRWLDIIDVDRKTEVNYIATRVTTNGEPRRRTTIGQDVVPLGWALERMMVAE